MDLLSERTYSNKTSRSDNSVLTNLDNKEIAKEITAYYNYIISNRRKLKEKQTKISQIRLNDDCYKSYGKTPPPTPIDKRTETINDGNENVLGFRNMRKKLVLETQSIHSLESENSDEATCSKNFFRNKAETKFTLDKSSNNKYKFQDNAQSNEGPEYAEKTTYCRPSTDIYNQDFVNKALERNEKLQGLVKRLILAREREKQKVAWNNYINELKNKHRYNESSTIPTYMPDNPSTDFIDDYYNTRFKWQQSNPCKNLLQDFYGASNETDLKSPKSYRGPLKYRSYSPENNRYCFPTSPGRFTIQKTKYNYTNFANRYRGSPIYVDKEDECTDKAKAKQFKLLDINKSNDNKNLSTHTDLTGVKNKVNNECSPEKSLIDRYKTVSSNVERLKQKVTTSENKVKYCSLSSIENKLDLLILSINTFINEIKTQRVSKNTAAVQLSSVSSLLNTTKSETYSLLRSEKIVCGLVQERPRSTLTFQEEKRHGTIDEILNEEMNKSNKAKKDIENMLSIGMNTPSVHITFDIPTKERATEITDSLSKAKYSKVIVGEISSQDKCMTIAVNTDPLGILALFRVSTEAMKQILSYMPQIDYHSYLSRLPIPQLARNEMTHYVCNICGAAFGLPSQLSDHIQAHNLGNSRNCCVCRHVVDMQRHKTGLFSCRHCGQRFTRAYCRELHERECGRTLGRAAGVTSSLMLLR